MPFFASKKLRNSTNPGEGVGCCWFLSSTGELPQKSASGRHGVVRLGAPPGASEGGNAAASPGAATGHLRDPAKRADRAAHAGTAAVREYGASRADAPGTHQVGRRLWRFWSFAWLIVNCFFGVALVTFLLNN